MLPYNIFHTLLIYEVYLFPEKNNVTYAHVVLSFLIRKQKEKTQTQTFYSQKMKWEYDSNEEILEREYF